MKYELNVNATNDLAAPHNIEAEEGLISCCCISGGTEIYDQISGTISHDDFYMARHRAIFKAIESIADRGDEISEISIFEQSKKDGTLDEVGNVAGIMEATGRVETAASVKYFAKLVKEKSELRQIARSCRVAAETAMFGTTDPDIIRADVEQSMISLSEKGSRKSKGLEESVELLREDYQKMMAKEYVTEAVKTHIDHLDDKLGNGGIAPGEVMVIAAPTSCGKSQLALNIALRASLKSDVGTAIVSLEMPQKQVTQRLVSCLSQVWIKRIRDGVATDSDVEAVNEALDTIKDLNIKSLHSVKSIQDLASQARSLVRSDNIKLLIIDYLQLIPFGQGRMSKNDAIADVSHRIKQLALELNLPIVLLCQVGREGAKRPGGLMLYDLKDSGDIENDADIVLLLWPKEGDVESSKKVDSHGSYIEMMYNVAKNREGERDVKGIFKFRHFVGRFY
jgi:replicative DNA helicase